MSNRATTHTKKRPITKKLRAFMKWQLAVIAMAALVALFTNSFNLFSIGSYLMLAGLVVCGFALMSTLGAWSNTRSFSYQYGMSVSEKDIIERHKDERVIMNSAFDFMFTSLGLGFSSMFIAGLLMSFF